MRYVVSSSFNDCQGLAVNPGFHLRRHSTSDAIIFFINLTRYVHNFPVNNGQFLFTAK